METLLHGLRAAGEPTRLRLLALLARNELTVSELTWILGQSQPRVSRHLKLLADAHLVSRFQEGSWVFYRLADQGRGAGLARALVRMLPEDDPDLARDYERLEAIKQGHARAASAYFRDVAERWDRVRSLYVAEDDVERAMLDAAGDGPIDSFLDLGTGTGRILQVFGERVERGLGIDSSREMLAVARANLEKRGLSHCQVRLGDILHLNVPAGAVDLATIHHVLHYLDDPAAAVAEAARTLRPGGRLLIVDFAPHSLEFLRKEYAHRRLGFSDDEVAGWCRDAGLEASTVRHLAAGGGEAKKLTVSLWCGIQRADAPSHHQLAVA